MHNSSDYLFQIIPPFGYQEGDGNQNIEVNFSGTSPYFITYNENKWFQSPLDSSGSYPAMPCYIKLNNIYLFRNFKISQSGTSDPTIYDDYDVGLEGFRNFDLNSMSSSPYYARNGVGSYDIRLVPDLGIQNTFFQTSLFPLSHSDRHFVWKQEAEQYTLDLEVLDSSGTLVDNWGLQVFVKVPFRLVYQ